MFNPLKHKFTSAILASLIFALFVLPLTEAYWFNLEGISYKQEIYRQLLHLMGAVFVFSISWFMLHFAAKLKDKSKFYRAWLIHTLVSLGALIILLCLMWPGYWRWDELDILHATNSYTLFSWQSLYTQIQYALSLYLLPFATGIIIIQLIAVAFIIGYISAKLRLLLRNTTLFILSILIFFSPVVLLSAGYTLRLQLIGFLLALLLFKFILVFIEKKTQAQNIATFFGLSALAILLATWRSENILYLTIIPILWIWLGLYRSPKPLIISVTFIVLLFGACYGVNKVTEDPIYKITPNLNTLSVMIHENLAGNSNDSLKKIDSAIHLDILEASPSNCNIPSRLFELPRADFSKNYSAYINGVTEIFVSNPISFLGHKLDLYIDTNHSGRSFQCRAIILGQFINNSNATFNNPTHPHAEWFVDTNKFSSPGNESLRVDTIKTLSLINLPDLRFYIWSVTPVLLMSAALFFHALFRKRLVWAYVFCLIISHAAAVFLFAPSSLFMYYFPIYIAGGLIAMLYITYHMNLRLKDKRSINRHAIIKGMNSKITQNKVLIAIPAYNCADQITRVLNEINPKLYKRVDEIAVIDNGSTDDTIQRALDFKKSGKLKDKLHIYKNTANYNLGGTHKVAFNKAAKEGFTHVVILHGDNQAKSAEANDLLDFAESHTQQTVLGSRFNKDSRLVGYDQKRILGNKVLNAVYSALALRKLEDLGSGLNLFYMDDLDKNTYLKFADKLTFNYELILDLVKRKVNFAYLPITWSEEDQISNARNFNIFKTALVNVVRWRVGKPATNTVQKSYTCKEVK